MFGGAVWKFQHDVSFFSLAGCFIEKKCEMRWCLRYLEPRGTARQRSRRLESQAVKYFQFPGGEFRNSSSGSHTCERNPPGWLRPVWDATHISPRVASQAGLNHSGGLAHPRDPCSGWSTLAIANARTWPLATYISFSISRSRAACRQWDRAGP